MRSWKMTRMIWRLCRLVMQSGYAAFPSSACITLPEPEYVGITKAQRNAMQC